MSDISRAAMACHIEIAGNGSHATYLLELQIRERVRVGRGDQHTWLEPKLVWDAPETASGETAAAK